MRFSNVALMEEVAQSLQNGQEVMLSPKGGSMFPFLVEGRDRVVLCQSEKYGVGDAVLVRLSESYFVLHRVYAVYGERLLLMGDGNLHQTEMCTQSQVIAVVRCIVRNGRTVDCSSRREQFLVALWRHLLPVRRYLLFLLRRFLAE